MNSGNLLRATPFPKWRPPVPRLAQTEAQIKTIAAGFTLVPTVLFAATSYVGFRLGTKDEGFPAVLGYTIGGLSALGALASLLITIGVINAPMEPGGAWAWLAPRPVPAPTPAPGLPPVSKPVLV